VRFEREAKSLAALNHPNIATLYGMEESAGQHFLVMELVPGVTLEELLEGPGRPEGRPLQSEQTILRVVTDWEALIRK